MKITKLFILSFILAITYIPFGFLYLVFVDVIKKRKNAKQKTTAPAPVHNQYCAGDKKQNGKRMYPL